MKIRLILSSIFLINALSAHCCDNNVNEIAVNVETLLKTSSDWLGQNLPHYPKKQPEITLLKVTIAPKTRLPWHYHPYINAGVIVKGKLKITTASGTTKVFSAGEALSEVVDIIHFGENISDENVELYIFYVGEKNGKALTIITEKKD